MGCDIHLFAEKKINGKWLNVDKYSKNPDYDPKEKGDWKEQKLIIKREDMFYTGGRNYNLFCALAGVRSYEFRNKPNIISAPKGKPKPCSMEYARELKKYSTDAHSSSYLNLSELLSFNWVEYGETCRHFFDEVIPKMINISKEEGVEEVRICFFFDN